MTIVWLCEGFLEMNELMTMLKSMGLRRSRREVLELVKSIDPDARGMFASILLNVGGIKGNITSI